MPFEIHLRNTEKTIEFGQQLAYALAKMEQPPALLLQGDLGSGKTTLVRGLVENLPGSEHAEVSSPSFNIFNVYPTIPPVAHFDLYRLEGIQPDEELFEYFEDPRTLVIIEWIQYLQQEDWPDHAILLKWSPVDSGRTLTFHASKELAQELAKSMPEFLQLSKTKA